MGMDQDEEKRARRRAELNRKLRQPFVDGAEERSQRELGRGLTPDELERVLKRYPGDLPEYARAVMSRPIRVRRATGAEVDLVVALDTEATRKGARRAVLRTAQSKDRLLVAERDGRIVGYATHGHFFEYDFLELLVVHENDRRTGVATALVNAVEAAAKSGKLFTSTNQSNEPMRRLCQRLGFEPSGVIHNLDEGDPELVFVKRL
jgi:GNAT superfamily N-acetyltransferase